MKEIFSMYTFSRVGRMFKRIYPMIILALIISIISLSCSQKESRPGGTRSSLKNNIDIKEITTELKKSIPTLMNEVGVPGLSIALIRDNDIAWHSAFGVINIETKQPVNNDTIFEAASLSKPVFAYMVLKLIARGELDLDTPLIEYAPEEYIKTKFLGQGFEDERYKKITARMALNHSTGFPNWREDDTIELRFDPGQKFGYSAEAFYYLQVIVEKISGQKLTELMRQEVFEPLGMTKSSYIWQPEFERNSAHRHDMMGEARGLRRHKRALGPATLQTTAYDYSLFLIAFMNGEGLDEQTYREMLKFQSTYRKEGCEGVDWGLGTGLETSDYGISIWHWGDNTYAQAFYLAFPDQKNGIVFFSNSFYGLALAKDIVGIAIGGEHPVMDCGIMQPYIKLGKPISAFIHRIKNEDFKEAEGFFRKNIHSYLGQESVYNEAVLNDIGYWLLKRKHLNSAIRIFRLNVEAYPESWIVYDSLGEAYMKGDNKDLAIQNYRKSLELNPDNTHAVKMLDKLNK